MMHASLLCTWLVWSILDPAWTLIQTPYIVYAVIFEGLIFRGSQICKDFRGLIFADHQVE